MNKVKSQEELNRLKEESDQFWALVFLSENSAKSMIAQKILDKIFEEHRTPIWHVDVGQTRNVHENFTVTQVPTIVTVKNGKVVKKLVGQQREGT